MRRLALVLFAVIALVAVPSATAWTWPLGGEVLRPYLLARREGLVLTDAHWELIRFLRQYYAEHGVQPQVRVMIRHFTEAWGPLRGSNHHLHEMFPRGGPQKQGNRLAGLLRTKGEH